MSTWSAERSKRTDRGDSALTGGDTDVTATLWEDDLYTLERQAFLALIQTPATLARIEQMLETGKPLRN